MDKYTFKVEFELTVYADSNKQAQEYMNKKHFDKSNNSVSFVNLPFEIVTYRETTETLEMMNAKDEDQWIW
jgi:hypothetical protein